MSNKRKDNSGECAQERHAAASEPGLASSLTIYYGLMLVLISIPILLLFVVLFIRVVFDYRVYLFVGGMLVVATGSFLLYRYRGRFKRKILKETTDIMEAVRSAAGDGQTVKISLLGGMMSVTYEGKGGTEHLMAGWTGTPSRALPAPPAEGKTIERETVLDLTDLPAGSAERVSASLAALDELLGKGVLTEEEYRSARKRLTGRQAS